MAEKVNSTIRLHPLQDRTRAHEQVVRQLEREILAGRLGLGDRLPPERDLAEMLNVGRTSVREALRTLEALGVLSVGRGRGENSGLIVVGAPPEVVTTLVRLQMALRQYSFDDVTAVRVLIERAAAAETARHPDTAGLHKANEILQQMRAVAADVLKFNDLDSEFHTALTAASLNPFLTYLLTALRGAIKWHMWERFGAADDWGDTSRWLLSQHEKLLAAIGAGDEERAADIVEERIHRIYSQWFQDPVDED